MKSYKKGLSSKKDTLSDLSSESSNYEKGLSSKKGALSDLSSEPSNYEKGLSSKKGALSDFSSESSNNKSFEGLAFDSVKNEKNIHTKGERNKGDRWEDYISLGDSNIMKYTITHFLNKKLKAIKTKDGDAYPVYIKLIFNSIPLIFKSKMLDWHMTDADFKKINNQELHLDRQFSKNALQVTIDSIDEKLEDFKPFDFYKTYEEFTMNVTELFNQETDDIIEAHLLVNLKFFIKDDPFFQIIRKLALSWLADKDRYNYYYEDEDTDDKESNIFVEFENYLLRFYGISMVDNILKMIREKSHTYYNSHIANR